MLLAEYFAADSVQNHHRARVASLAVFVEGIDGAGNLLVFIS